LGEDVVELARALADEVGKDFPLLLARKVGAGRRRGQVELGRIARVLGHERNCLSLAFVSL
jgi:hypothetical protein